MGLKETERERQTMLQWQMAHGKRLLNLATGYKLAPILIS
jgi:hypothetical protein